MHFVIQADLVDRLLLGPVSGGRIVQDSPIRGDVLAAYALAPEKPRELLLTPYRSLSAAKVASALAHSTAKADPPSRVSYLEGVVAARLTLDGMLMNVLTMTRWWQKIRDSKLTQKSVREAILDRVNAMYAEASLEDETLTTLETSTVDRSAELVSAAALLTFLGAVDLVSRPSKGSQTIKLANISMMAEYFKPTQLAQAGLDIYRRLKQHCEKDPSSICNTVPMVFAISQNRPVELAVSTSANTIKADSARLLFSTDCSGLAWAILDSGIDAAHEGFRDHERGEGSRVRAAYDFTRIRDLICPDYQFNSARLTEAAKLFAREGLTQTEVKADLRRLAEDAELGHPIDWSVARKYVEIVDPLAPANTPQNAHGTHVAGILGADWREDDGTTERLTGVCPGIKLYDFRVVGAGIEDTEFNVMGAMQFIRWLNERNNYRVIHGTNMSLSIPHSVRNYACGATPVCEEAERLVRSGVFVTAAAGNRGYQSFQLRGGDVFENYAPSSITDPGNAEAILTVGATHRGSPHTYGVSFFSSRGPTGDGRAKPDLLAPGEKIVSLVPGNAEDTRDGTSMAAPHAAGAAALLMARNPEFEGKPEKIKQILVDTCTDLGRERSFQGAGLIDVLRALQSI
ncbi:MAG: S8 family serine peptidase [Pseudomonadota bacterium]